MSRVTNFSIQISCYISPVIINSLSAVTTPISGWAIPDNVANNLADPEFFKAGSIDLIIAESVFFELLEPE